MKLFQLIHTYLTNLLLSILVIFSLSANLFAEEAKRGRLSDGRAFRTDAEGVQLVDYIAELEVNVEELSRKINGLESELEEKDRLIERKGIKRNQRIEERDILEQKYRQAAGSDGLSYADCLRVTCPEPAPCGEDLAFNSGDHSKDFRETSLDNQVAELNTKIVEQDSSLRLKDQEISQLKLQIARSATSPRDEDLASRVSDLEQIIKGKNERIEGLVAEISAKDQNIVNLKKAAASNAQQQKREKIGFQKASLSTAKLKALQSVKSSLRSEYNRLKGLTGKRDMKLKEYRRYPKRAVKFNASKLTSSRGLSLGAIRAKIDQAQSMKELGYLKRALKEIRFKVQKDIDLLNRMIRMSKRS